MPTYTCIPSAVTVAPCPTGTAPNSTIVTSTLPKADYYPGKFSGLPEQDVTVVLILVVMFALGFIGGLRR